MHRADIPAHESVPFITKDEHSPLRSDDTEAGFRYRYHLCPNKQHILPIK